jgi:small subunit ribosomal protein S18
MAKPRGRSASKKGRKLGPPTARKRRPLLKPDELDWKNYPSLRRFLSERGKIRSRRITGLSRRQQSMLAAAVKRAREMGLLAYPDQDRKVRVGGGPDATVPVLVTDGAVEETEVGTETVPVMDESDFVAPVPDEVSPEVAEIETEANADQAE